MQQPDDAEAHGDEEHRLQKLNDANCDEPAIAVWMGMRCQSAVLVNPAFKPMIHPRITQGLIALFPQHAAPGIHPAGNPLATPARTTSEANAISSERNTNEQEKCACSGCSPDVWIFRS